MVIDVACGTGLNFDAIREKIGSEGQLFGVDLSAEMLEVARRRVARNGWRNVSLLRADVIDVALPEKADAALFSFTHDVLGSERAVASVISQLSSGARVSSVGAHLPGSRSPLNPLVRLAARPFVADPRGLDFPWRKLSRFADLHTRLFLLGAVHLSAGPLREGAAQLAAGLMKQYESGD